MYITFNGLDILMKKSKTNSRTTTIQISHKTKERLDNLKETEQLSTYDAVIRIILLEIKLLKETNSK